MDDFFNLDLFAVASGAFTYRIATEMIYQHPPSAFFAGSYLGKKIDQIEVFTRAPDLGFHQMEWGIGGENTGHFSLVSERANNNEENPDDKTIRQDAYWWRGGHPDIFKWIHSAIPCRASLAIILISLEITHTRNAAHWYRAPFSDGEKKFRLKRGFTGRKEG